MATESAQSLFTHPRALDAMGLMVEGGQREAIALLDRALEAEPKQWELFFARGMVHMNLDEKERSLLDLETALRLGGREHPRLYLALGVLLQRLSSLDRSVEMLGKATKLDPEHAAGWAERGASLTMQGKWAEAETDLSRAIELDGTDENAYRDRAGAYIRLGKPDLADADFARADQLKKASGA